MDAIVTLVGGFVAKYPVVAAIFMGMGVLRAILHPIFAMLEAYAAATPNPNDDKILMDVEQSKIVQGLYFVLNYLFSVNLIK